MKNSHVHKDVIIAYAKGAAVEWKNEENEWERIENPIFYEDEQYRVKPDGEWPVTSLSERELEEIYNDAPGTDFSHIANAAIKQYIIDTEK